MGFYTTYVLYRSVYPPYVFGASFPLTQGEQARRTRRHICQGGEKWEGCIHFYSQPTMSVVSSPSGVWGGAPAKKRIRCIFGVTKHFFLQDIVNHKNSVIQAEMQTGQQTRAFVTVRINMHCQLISFVISRASVGLFGIMAMTAIGMHKGILHLWL